MESSEFSDIVASDGSLLRIVGGKDFVNDNLHESVVIVIELHSIFFPELLGMDWSPLEEASLNLVLPLLERTEFLVVLVEIGPESFQEGSDFLVNPVSVLKLNN